MALVSLLGFDFHDVSLTRKICIPSSLRGFRRVSSPIYKHSSRQAVPLYLSYSCTALRSGMHEKGTAEKGITSEIESEASVSLHGGLWHQSVSVASPFPPQPPQFGVSQWFAMAVGFVLAFLIQLGISKFRRRSESGSLIAQVRQSAANSGANVPMGEDGETIEWVNMCWRKIWRVYQQGLEKWLAGVLQPVFNKVVRERAVPQILQGIQIVEMTFDHQAPYFTNLRRRTSRKDSDLNGVVDVRYTGGARMLLMLEVGGGKWHTKVPVLVSDLDLECQLWLKVRLAPLTPYLGTLSFAFVDPPNIKVQLAPYNRVRLMRVPVLQNFLTRLLTKVLPGYMVLPKRLNINIPPAITAVAEAAVGRDAVMRAVASAVLQADVLEQSLMAVLPLGPQSAAGGISLPKSFQGELSVALIEGRNLSVWGFPWQSNPYCRLTLGKQAVLSKRENDTGTKGGHQQPIWNQEFEFLVDNLQTQKLEVYIKDAPITGRPEVGKVEFQLSELPKDGSLSIWLPVQQVNPGQETTGELHLDLSYKPFVDEDYDAGYIGAEKLVRELENIAEEEIIDIKSAAAASSKAAAEASAAFSAIAITRAAAARAAHKAQNAALAARKIANLGGISDEEEELGDDEVGFDPDTYDMEEMQLDTEMVAQNGTVPPDEDQVAEVVIQEERQPDMLVRSVGERQTNGKESWNGVPNDNGVYPISQVSRDGAEEASAGPEAVIVTDPVSSSVDVADTTTIRSFPVDITAPDNQLPEPLSHSSTADDGNSSHAVAANDADGVGQSRRKPWWLNVVRRRTEKAKQDEASTTEPPEEKTTAAEPEKKDRIRWWMWLTSSIAFWKTRSQIIASDDRPTTTPKPKRKIKDKKSNQSGDSVVLPPDLPLEEIAKEVVRLKTVTDKSEEERMNRVYTEVVERSDRKWIMLLCFLITLSIGMLTIVAMRIGPL